MPLKYGMIIDGQAVGSRVGESFSVYNPATGEKLAEVPVAGSEDVESAAKSSDEAFKQWRETPAIERTRLMEGLAEKIRGNEDALGRLLTQEQGKPLIEAKGEVVWAAGLLDYYAGQARDICGQIPPAEHPERIVFILKEPVGVVASITPWNFPILLLVRMVGPAWAAGCTVIAKPASDTPLTTLRIAELALEAGLPPGVLNVITGPGSSVGEALTLHPSVRKIAFTGSLEIGRRTMELASRGIKHVTLELGGQCPAIVCADANLDIAIDAITFKAFQNAGQVCNRVNRVYVFREIADEVKEGLVQKAEKIVVGNGLEEGVGMGPIINERQFSWVHSHVEDAKAKGGRVLTGGRRLSGNGYDKGYFYPPTYVDQTNHEMLLMKEETFGPVTGIMEVDSLDQALELANDTVYGLSAFLFTQNFRDGWRGIRELEAGSIWVNDIHGTYPHCPYGGMKQSGLGREQSPEAVNEYLEVKTVYYDLAQEKRG